MSLKSEKGKPLHEIALPFRSEKVRKNLASFRDDHDEARMPTGLVLNLSDPPFAVERPSGAIPEEACRDPDPLPKGADKARGGFSSRGRICSGIETTQLGNTYNP